MRMRRIVLSSVACPAVSGFSTFSRKNYTNFGEKIIFWSNFETFLILRRIQRDIIINVLCRHVSYLLFLS